ncbi:hypothetical protein ABC502_15245 [Alkalimonas sp. NCh-2]|uniref:hypothetical protein n=1 Tax=Alkalimonas sp. NCh-2 TaxID=3144846 RepID=UPI0031F70691
MKIIILAFLVFCMVMLSPASMAQTRQQTPFDIAELLVQGASADEIFQRAVGSTIRVEPEYLGVRFYNTNTNTELANDDIRVLMGPLRQDGAYQVIEIALALSSNRLGLNQSQLEQLVDAAFIATMRRPPEYISIEFYDTRVGPAGTGGGSSGRVPDALYSEAGVKVTDSQSESFHQAIQESHELVASLLPVAEDELRNLLRALDIKIERRDGYIALPAMAAARSKDGLEHILNAKRTELEVQFGVSHIEHIDWRMSEPSPGVYFMIEVGYYVGPAATLRELEREMDGVFYR